MDNMHPYDMQKYHESKVRELPAYMDDACFEYEQAPILSGVGRLIHRLGEQLASWALALKGGSRISWLFLSIEDRFSRTVRGQKRREI